MIKPAWGSLIADIVFGLATPFILFGTMLVTPRLFRPGSFLDIINQTRTELLMLFALAAIWISGALALASDLRGQENCLWCVALNQSALSWTVCAHKAYV